MNPVCTYLYFCEEGQLICCRTIDSEKHGGARFKKQKKTGKRKRFVGYEYNNRFAGNGHL